MHPFAGKFDTLKGLGKIALYGVGLGVIAWLTSQFHGPELIVGICGVLAAILVVPVVVFFGILPILHWKARYRGEYSDWWGVLLVLQLSGWPAAIYFFRHILPDMRRTGRYRTEPDSPQLGSTPKLPRFIPTEPTTTNE